MNDKPIEGDAVEVISSASLSTVIKAEIDQAIATAHAFPRSLRNFLEEAKSLVTFDENMAQACIYALPRKDENGNRINITGPSARFAEIIQSTFGNNRGGGRVIGDEGGFIVAQGVFHDLEKNTSITMEVRRRITNRAGKRFTSDMIAVTGNAAASIAHRNAVLKGVPKAMWLPLYEAAVAVAVGKGKPMSERRARAFEVFNLMGVDKKQLLTALGLDSEVKITDEHIETMVGWRTAIKEGTAKIEEIFGDDEPETTAPGATDGRAGMANVGAALAAKRGKAKPDKAPTAAAAEPDGVPKAEPERAVVDGGNPQPTAAEVIKWLGKCATVSALNDTWEMWGGDALDDYLPDDAKMIAAAYENRREELENAS